MIKIIISGTSDGFYPRYASDGVLDDGISNLLMDRRHFITKDADRLNKEGFSFQPLANGILFHKIIPLFDAFGRDGFMVASLFLPEGEMLDGNEIKEALDAIMREYKMHVVGGIANVELDWSFVKQKADELNAKVRPMIWKKHPSQGDASRTALIKGADNRVSEYFQYPTPLHPGYAGYGQVFLTESLLDSAMVSDNGEQGYKVLTTDDVDIDNPVYEIIYNNPNGYSTSALKKNVEKKELMATTGGYFCGTISQNGYRSKDIYIPADRKTSLDGMTLEVDIPALVSKEASVSLKISDLTTGSDIPLENCTINWKSNQYYDAKWEPRMHTGRLFSFVKEECDTTWSVKVSSDQYEEKEIQVTIADGDNDKPVIMELLPNPTWTIIIGLPKEEERRYKEKQSKKDSRVKELVSDLKKQGLEVETPKEDRNGRTVSLIAKYPQCTIKVLYGSQKLTEKMVPKNELEAQIGELKEVYGKQGLVFDKIEDSTNGVLLYFAKKQASSLATTSSGRENVFKDSTVTVQTKEPEKKKWVLRLDEKSKNYSIFKNGAKRSELEKEAEDALANLKSALEAFTNLIKATGKDAKTVDYIKGQIGLVIEELPRGKSKNLENAKKHFGNARNKVKNKSFSDNPVVGNLISCASEAVKTYGAYLRIPSVVAKPQNVFYDYNDHRLVVEQESKPSFKPVFGKDHYSYSFAEDRPDWADESDFYAPKGKHRVERKLLSKYMFLWFVLPLLIIGGAVALYFIIDNDKDDGEKIANLIESIEMANDTLQNKYSTHYCDSALYEKYVQLRRDVDDIDSVALKEIDTKVKFKLDSVCVIFDKLMKNQAEFKDLDADNYARLEFLKDSIKSWDEAKQKFFEDLKVGETFEDKISCMSNSHKKDVRKWYNERLQEKSETTTPPKQGIEQHQQIINGPGTLFNASTYTDVMNKYNDYRFNFAKNLKYCESLKDSICIAVIKKNISESDYNNYYSVAKKEPSDQKKVRKLKALLWGENTNDSSSQIEVQHQESIQQQKISKASELFAVLTYDNVSGSKSSFDEKYSLSESMKNQYDDPENGKKTINDIIDAVHNKNISEEDYNDIYNDANSEATGSKKITALVNGLENFKKK